MARAARALQYGTLKTAAERRAYEAGVQATDDREREKRKHNGWTNYETWIVNLWLTNEEDSYRYWRMRAAWARKQKAELDDCASILAAELKAEVQDNKPEEFLNSDGMNHGSSGLYSDLLGAALSEVNWFEIAKSFLEE